MSKSPPTKSKSTKSNNSNAWTGNKNYKPPKIPPKEKNKPKPTGKGKPPPRKMTKEEENMWKKSRCSASRPC
jgi:hypothetical protein